ncbi:methanogenesis marker 2 protein [Methanothermococcus okinawensis]|uniref:Methanogenesis marker protein 2 n=1 Tax=Methanothermococcus okinawensis (strain DSM 14208 / JCM 11175 / IH1) TaxID=647113 RepID=F8AKF9_METOI|nr:methanogenesis marker 2 protein [Methanothermococcus okinawensis]AEH07485.1 methanogenesis marker protein 2 [Methanothermococcus okinawensis IH1]
MNLKKIASELKNFEGVLRKKEIKNVVNNFKFEDNDYYFDIISDFGDDAAVIGIDNENAILLAADGIWGKLLESDPWWAGYCSVLVNTNDIAAMGGKSIAMTNIIGIRDCNIGRKVLKGVKDGMDKFGVPMVGGHTHPDANNNVLDVSITGIVKKDNILRSDNAQIGDKIVFAYDLDGKIYKNFDLNWDTTTMKSKKLVRDQLRALEIVGEEKLANACKDISNPGALGTLGMLLEVSKKGAHVDINKIPRNESVPLIKWLKLYPGCGFVFTAPEDKIDRLKEVLELVNITAEVCGEVTASKQLIITDGKDKEVLFDFDKEYICGC